MRVIRGVHNIRPPDRGVAVSLGNFDGVHLGHQALFAKMRVQMPGTRCCAICFEPQPLEMLRPKGAPLRLQSLAEKLRCLRDTGLDQVLVLSFNHALARMPAADFVRKILIEELGVRQIVVGDDYRFGHKRQGDIGLLRKMAVAGYEVVHLDTVREGEERISSTRVRAGLQQGDIELATRCLGRPYRLRGRVVHGQKLGRQLGAPTANVALRRPTPLRHGVYCVRLNQLPAVANIGLRPTVGGSGEHLEVHLLSGKQHQLYGQMVTVDFEAFLRPEQRFADFDELRQAIAADVQKAHTFYRQDLS